MKKKVSTFLVDSIFYSVDDRFKERAECFRLAASFNDECQAIKVRSSL